MYTICPVHSQVWTCHAGGQGSTQRGRRGAGQQITPGN